jgi:hypothetical protein
MMIDHQSGLTVAASPAFEGPLAALRRFAGPREADRTREKCELCGAGLASEHQHLVELDSRRLACSCDACALLFGGQTGARYRRVPRRIEFLPDFRLSDLQWESLLIPINLAFFFHSTPAGRVLAVYPSPAGATESLLGLEAWHALVEDNPMLAGLQPDVEALLVNRMGRAREYYRVPIDQCYRLVGLIRLHWRGLSGGTEAWEKVGQFFAGLREKSQP